MAIARRLRQFVGRARGGVWFGRPYLTHFRCFSFVFLKGLLLGIFYETYGYERKKQILIY